MLFMMSCATHKTLTNLDSLSEKKRNAYLKTVSKETVLKYGAGYYRDYKEPVISRGQFPPKSEINPTGENAGRIFYLIVYQYDGTKEQFSFPYLSRVQVWADTGKPSGVSFGNGFGIIIPENGLQEGEFERIPYEQIGIFPIYDFPNGKNETNSDPINKDELIKRGFEKQPDGTWVKVHPDVPPKY